MPKFKKGDKVKVRSDSNSQFRGRIGIVSENPVNDSYGYMYIIKFESKGYTPTYRIGERDLEAVSD